MTRNIHVCLPSDTLDRAARIMWDHDLGVVPIVDRAHRLLGVVTDRDACMGAYTQNKRLSDIPSQDVMSRKVFAVHPEDPLPRALDLMRQAQVRRIPVVDEDETLIGMLTQNDLIREANRELRRGNRALADEILQTLATISSPRSGSFAAAAQ
jgi:CBS domain-containing protein